MTLKLNCCFQVKEEPADPSASVSRRAPKRGTMSEVVEQPQVVLPGGAKRSRRTTTAAAPAQKSGTKSEIKTEEESIERLEVKEEVAEDAPNKRTSRRGGANTVKVEVI